jgi:hypothetical protein
VVRHGALHAEEVAQILQRARFALTNVTEQTWSKSGTFMACAANGCAVVLADGASDSPPIGFCISAEELATISDDEADRRTAALRAWYCSNADWPVIATRMASLW